jgi:hypothetical protein
MANTSAIDAQIRKLEKAKQLLADDSFRELIADPEILELMKAAISTNGNGHKANRQVTPPNPEAEELPAEGSLKRKVLETARALPGKFNTRDVVKKLEADGHQFERDAAIAVNQALRHLSNPEKGWIRLVREGSGRIPHIYEAIRKDNIEK